MITLTASLDRARWPLPRILTLLLAGAFGGLMMDIRVEHVDAVRDHSIAWLPILFSGLMAVVCSLGAIVWSAKARSAMLVLFPLVIVVGGIGFYLHNRGHLMRVMQTQLQAWTDPGMNHPDTPPQTAPLAFAGLGLIGILTSLRRFNA